MWLCCCLLVLLMTEHMSKGKSKSEMFSFYTGEKRNKKKKNNKTKQPQIHCYAICLNLVWTACTAHNLSVITHSSELEREQEDKYNSAIYSLILKKITLLWHASHFSSNTMIWLSRVWGDWTACNILTHFSFGDSVRSWETTPIHRAALVISPPLSGVFCHLISAPDLCPAQAEQHEQQSSTELRSSLKSPETHFCSFKY